MKLICSDRILDFDHPKVMGILNVTPDSFYDGGQATTSDKAFSKADRLIRAGADIIDVGGESTRPGASKISTNEEIDRVIPVIEHIAKNSDITISIDTSSPAVMQAAVRAGATIINDVRALQKPGALEMAASLDVPVILMHSLVEQPVAKEETEYEDIITSISSYLKSRVTACENAGIERNRIILDPGFGGGMFGKNTRHNLEMIKRFEEFHHLGLPLLAGVSRKSFIGDVLEKDPENRLFGSLAAAVALVMAGVHIIRVHDVQETQDVVKISHAIQCA